jgi:hypothetical protein
VARTAITSIEDIQRDLQTNGAINRPDFKPRVSYNKFNADPLSIVELYWYHPPDYMKFLGHATRLTIQIIECSRAEEIARSR